MTGESNATLAAEVARAIVSDVAPDELPLFEISSEAFLADPAAAAAADRDEMLGFGGGAELELLTPVVLSISTGVIAFLMNSVLSAARSEGQAVIQARVRQLFKPFAGDTASARAAAPAPLTVDQLAEVRRVALNIATEMHVPPDRADLLADATVGQLVLDH